MAGRWEHYAHGADIGVRGVGDTLPEAFAQAAMALTAAAVDLDDVRADVAVRMGCAGNGPEDLLYAWLNAVIYEMATRRMLFARYDVAIEGDALEATAWGEPVEPARHQPAVEIKGATFTTLRVCHENGQWVAQCVVDV